MKKLKSAFIVSAPFTGSGKTTVQLGLLELFKKNGFDVIPFKCGPDYLDPIVHKQIAGKASWNLDGFFSSKDELRHEFNYRMQEGEIGIVEGFMGLYDGAVQDFASTAYISKTLNLPIILVIDAHAMAFSVAPILYGYKHFDPDINIAAVIFNRVNGDGHYRFLQDACEKVGIPSLGYLPQDNDLSVPERHLGINIHKVETYKHISRKIANQLEENINIPLLQRLTNWKSPELEILDKLPKSKRFKLALADDDAFNFSYPSSISSMEKYADIIRFSPLYDKELPEADAVYLPGGYPEFYLKELTLNNSMKESIINYCNSGKPLLAECGGMMYLGQHIIDQEGDTYKMCGFLDFDTSIQKKALKMGYREIHYSGEVFKGHEFHYSYIASPTREQHKGEVYNASNISVNLPLYTKKNVLASYVHFHLFGNAIFKLLGLIKE